jgi:HSP20 family protein
MRTTRNLPGLAINLPDVMQSLFADEFFKPMAPSNFVPAVNIEENEEQYTIHLMVPGFEKEQFNIQVDDNKLTISAELKNETEKAEPNFTVREFRAQSFIRTFTLPKHKINGEMISANYKNGVLVVALPKLEEAKPKAPKVIDIA